MSKVAPAAAVQRRVCVVSVIVPETYFKVPVLKINIVAAVKVIFPAREKVPENAMAEEIVPIVPPVTVILMVPAVAATGAENPPQLKTSAVVLLIVVVVVEQVSVPVIVQSPTSVLVLDPEKETGPGKVFPLLVMVLVALIVIDPVPETVHEWLVRSVKFPATVKTIPVLIVIVEV